MKFLLRPETSPRRFPFFALLTTFRAVSPTISGTSWTLIAAIAALISLTGEITAFGQTIHLPTLRFFGSNTVVSVPDRGTTHTGGNTGYRAGRISRGIPGMTTSRGIGSSTTAGNAAVTVQILNLDELEAAHMAGFSPRSANRGNFFRIEPDPAVQRKAAFLTQHVGRKENLAKGEGARGKQR